MTVRTAMSSISTHTYGNLFSLRLVILCISGRRSATVINTNCLFQVLEVETEEQTVDIRREGYDERDNINRVVLAGNPNGKKVTKYTEYSIRQEEDDKDVARNGSMCVLEKITNHA